MDPIVTAPVGDLLDARLVGDVLDTALGRGADFAEVFVEDKATQRLSYLDSQVRDAATGQVSGVGIRVLYGTRAVYAYTSDLSRDHLLATARAVSHAQEGEAPRRSAPLSPLTGARVADDPRSVSAERKLAVLERADRAARAASREVTQVDVSVTEWLQKVLIANSEGLFRQDVRPYTRIAIQAIASDGHEFQTGSQSPGALQGWEWLEGQDIEELARTAAAQAVTMLRAGYAPSGRIPVVIDKGFGGVILHEACGHLLETTSVATGASVLAGKMGEIIAHPSVTVVDDGTIEGEWGSLAIDDEGMPTEKTTLIAEGKLVSYIVDRLGGLKTGYRPTGSGRRESYRFAPTSRMRNTYIAPGPHTLEELIASIPYGLYAKQMGGGSVSPGTGDFNFSVREAYLIRDGKVAEPVRGATLIGNGADILHRIDMVGRDLALAAGMCGSSSGSIPVNVGQPPVRVNEIVVGGRS
jgi:TldD protein